MAIVDWIPPYWRDTEDFKALADTYRTTIQPNIDRVEALLRSCTHPSAWPDDVKNDVLMAAGYVESRYATTEERTEILCEALRNRRLLTEQKFVSRLRRAMNTEEGDPDPWTLDINNHHNISVTVNCDVEYLSDETYKRGESPTFVYDNFYASIQNNFPAGVRLLLNAKMPDVSHQKWIGAVPTVTIENRIDVTVSPSEISAFEIDWTEHVGTYTPFEGYEFDGVEYATETDLNRAGLYLLWNEDVWRGQTQYRAIEDVVYHRVAIEGYGAFDLWYNFHERYGFTHYSTSEITVYNKNSFWEPVPALMDTTPAALAQPITYFVLRQWYADESAMNAAGYYVEIPIEGFEYGVMGASEDSDKAVWPMGNVGHIEREMGDMVDAGFVEYGVMKEPSRMTVTVGTTATVPATTFAAESPYYWFYNFQSGTSYRNLWDPTKWANNINPSNPPGSDYTIPDSNYAEVWLWDGQSVLALANSSYTFHIGIYNLRPEFYTSNSVSVNKTLCACVIQPAAGSAVFTRTEYSLPNDLFTVSGTTLTWNTAHHLYNILNGKTVTILYYA